MTCSKRTGILLAALAALFGCGSTADTGPDGEVRLLEPLGVALDAGGNRALVVDFDLGALVAIDLDTGDRVVVSAPRSDP